MDHSNNENKKDEYIINTNDEEFIIKSEDSIEYKTNRYKDKILKSTKKVTT